MLSDLMRDAAAFNLSAWSRFVLAGLGIFAFVGIYYLGDYLFRDSDPEADPAPD
jgi:hypothetical protein